MRSKAYAISAILIFSALGCSDHFPAVKAAGAAGQVASAHSSALLASSIVCRDVNVLTRGKAACDDVAKQAARWEKVADALGAYGAKLAALADAQDLSLNDPVQSALAAAANANVVSLSSDQEGAIASFAGVLAGVLSERYRAHVLDDVIGKTDPSLQRVIALLKAEAELRLGEIKKAEGAIDKTVDAIQLGAAPAAGQAGQTGATVSGVDAHAAAASVAALLLMRQDLETKSTAYRTLDVSLTAFGDAHADLAKHVGDLKAETLAKEIVQIISAATTAVKSLKSGSAAIHSSLRANL